MDHLLPKFEHVFVAVIIPPPPPPFFCTDTFITSLLLIVCALKMICKKSLYRHLFLEDISKQARVTKKMALPNF